MVSIEYAEFLFQTVKVKIERIQIWGSFRK